MNETLRYSTKIRKRRDHCHYPCYVITVKFIFSNKVRLRRIDAVFFIEVFNCITNQDQEKFLGLFNYYFLLKAISFLNMDSTFIYSSFTKLWQSYSDPHPKISPIAIFVFYSLNYSLVARLQHNSRPKSPTKIETKRKLQQFTVSGWLIINGERVVVNR